MNAYTTLEDDIYSIFSSESWKAELVPTYPSNFSIPETVDEFIRVNIVPSGSGLNLQSKSGILIIDIFAAANEGLTRFFVIADKLDTFLVGESVSTSLNNVTQFSNSALSGASKDPDRPSLARMSYSISFNYFVVT